MSEKNSGSGFLELSESPRRPHIGVDIAGNVTLTGTWIVSIPRAEIEKYLHKFLDTATAERSENYSGFNVEANLESREKELQKNGSLWHRGSIYAFAAGDLGRVIDFLKPFYPRPDQAP